MRWVRCQTELPPCSLDNSVRLWLDTQGWESRLAPVGTVAEHTGTCAPAKLGAADSAAGAVHGPADGEGAAAGGQRRSQGGLRAAGGGSKRGGERVTAERQSTCYLDHRAGGRGVPWPEAWPCRTRLSCFAATYINDTPKA